LIQFAAITVLISSTGKKNGGYHGLQNSSMHSLKVQQFHKRRVIPLADGNLAATFQDGPVSAAEEWLRNWRGAKQSSG